MLRVNLLLLCLFCSCMARAQQYSAGSKVLDELQQPAIKAVITLTDYRFRQLAVDSAAADGLFTFRGLAPGLYYLYVDKEGYRTARDSFHITAADIILRNIQLKPAGTLLDEVKIRLQDMQQHNDTLEYLSSGFKVNEDASTADLVRKMPAISVEGDKVMVQGEVVRRIWVDGKPFFGDNAMATLKNLPADMVARVQVFNEKSEQEKFTGFSEAPSGKVINVVTKEGRNKGSFGKLYGGYGLTDNSRKSYAAGASVNQFNGDSRITVTAQQNNVNSQYFSDNGNAMLSSGKGSGLVKGSSLGLNYSDRLGKKTEFNGSYYLSQADNQLNGLLNRVYVLAADSGQIYKESRQTQSVNTNHALSTMLKYIPNAANSLQWQSQLMIGGVTMQSRREGVTSQAGAEYNRTGNNNSSRDHNYGLENNLLLQHKFPKKGRTVSLNMAWIENWSAQEGRYQVANTFTGSGLPASYIDQQNRQGQASRNLSGDLQLTEAIGKKSMLKWQYLVSSRTSSSDRNTAAYSPADSAYSIRDTSLSGSLFSRYELHKTGLSYQVRYTKTDYTATVNYQFSRQINEMVQDKLKQNFNNLLLTTSLQHKFSPNRNLRAAFTTNTQNPGISQLQAVVNNSDPLHLSTGNPALKQASQYMLQLQYNNMNREHNSQFAAAIRSSVVRNYITSTSLVAVQDTVVLRNIFLPRGAQINYPVNTQGYATVNGNLNYAMPLKLIRSNINVNANLAFNRVPGVINGRENIQQNRTMGIGLNITSNVSEHIDFTISSAVNMIRNANSLNEALTNSYRNYTLSGYLGLQLDCGLLFHTSFNYQANTGLAAGFNQDYLLWNLSAGMKFLKHKQAEIRFTVFDVLNKNRSITYQVTQSYEETGSTNNLQRYFMLLLSYKLRGY